ncbi:hypothetical protein NA57DRAFT_74726 [Rhizodiscina lignyota]|uniref:Clr5 domain-containing protein n=1 Tax=Rhizodiscina lignyota TaxID=1504668 RepID=A0A9P4M8K5_9PEZI|nr:hypothetical protein NA57DRAFT_74726 [Rhizodiscina lignyota]
MAQSLRWVPQDSKPRAPRISNDEWNRHKDELCNLYRIKTLQEVMVHMSAVYGFHATQRQYVSQFEKWGIRKYSKASEASFTSLRMFPSSTTGLSDAETLHTIKVETRSLKRGLPSFSNSYTDDVHDRSDTIKKKHRFLDGYRNDFLPKTTSKTRITSEELMGNVNANLEKDRDVPLKRVEAWAEGRPLFHIHARGNVIYQTGLPPLDQALVKADLRNLKHAAEFNHTLGYGTRAFDLYDKIIYLLQNSDASPVWEWTWAFTGYIQSAIKFRCDLGKDKVEAARTLLEAAINDLHGNDSLAPIYILKSLLMDMTKAIPKAVPEKPEELLSSPKPDITGDALIKYLPDHDRSMDLWTYTSWELQAKRQLLDKDDVSYRIKFLAEDAAMKDRLIYRLPGPFELEFGVMKNPCLRSCIRWCYHTLAELRCDTDKLTDEFSAAVAAADFDGGNEQIVTFALLCLKWHAEQLGSPEWSYPAVECLSWIANAELWMGISAYKVLRTVVEMLFTFKPESYEQWINAANSWMGFESLHSKYKDALDYVNQSAAALMRQNDTYLARLFLDTFATLHVTIKSESETVRRRVEVDKPPQRLHVREAHSLLEYTARFPNANATHQGGEEEGLGPVSSTTTSTNTAARALPPLGTSPQSEGSESFRQLKSIRDRMQLSRPAGNESSTPSKVFKSGSTDTNFVSWISHLCGSFQSSLSLSSPRT